MTREYEFRAKRGDSNQWVYGYYSKLYDKETNNIEAIISYQHFETADTSFPFPAVDIINVKVDEETVGRPIGKKDIKDIPIYEGDIFKFKFMEELNKPIELIGSFVWNDEDLSYEIDIYSNEHPEYVCLHYAGNGQMYDFEIIGNIFDNAELLNK